MRGLVNGRGRGGNLPEGELVRRAVRVGPPGSGFGEPAGGGEDLDWSHVIGLAKGHGVLALLARSLKARGWDGVPPSVVQELVTYRSALTARNLFLTRQLLEMLELFADHGITALPYKGPLLSAYAYGDVGMRPFGDLDVILSEADLLPARDLLVSKGYRSISPLTDSERPGGLPRGYAMALRGPDDRVLVELHWKLGPSFPLDMADLLPGVRPFPLLDSTVPCLSPEQFLLVLCVHGAKHAWERLEWVCGVAHLISRHPELDWDRVAGEAKAVGAKRSMALGLALAVAVAGAPVPESAMKSTGGSEVRSLATEMEAGLLCGERSSDDAVARYSRRFRAGTLQERARYLLFLRHPTEKDRSFVALPRRLSFLYFLVRPLRVLHEHAPRAGTGAWQERARRRQAERALARQLEHQAAKAEKLRGRDDEVRATLAERWARVKRRLQRFKPDWDDPRILEVGSGAHGILFGSGSSRAVGVDPLAVDYARVFPGWQRNAPTVAASGEQLPFGDGTFDVVLCDNVIDHAERPAAIVDELARLLAPGGLLYFTVNVHHRLYSVFARAHRAWNAVGVPLEIGPFADHTVHLTPDEARQLFRHLPLEIVRERTYLAEAKERARHRRIRGPGQLVPMIFFKNARFEVIARRR